jgi:hypothetical protein
MVTTLCRDCGAVAPAAARGECRDECRSPRFVSHAALGALAIAHVDCDAVMPRLKKGALAAGAVTLKLKTADFRLRTRSRRLADPAQLAETLLRTATPLPAVEADGVTRFRLVGVAADALVDSGAADPPTLFDLKLDRPRRLECAMDQIRGRLGDGSVRLGRDLPAVGVTPDGTSTRAKT